MLYLNQTANSTFQTSTPMYNIDNKREWSLPVLIPNTSSYGYSYSATYICTAYEQVCISSSTSCSGGGGGGSGGGGLIGDCERFEMQSTPQGLITLCGGATIAGSNVCDCFTTEYDGASWGHYIFPNGSSSTGGGSETCTTTCTAYGNGACIAGYYTCNDNDILVGSTCYKRVVVK